MGGGRCRHFGRISLGVLHCFTNRLPVGMVHLFHPLFNGIVVTCSHSVQGDSIEIVWPRQLKLRLPVVQFPNLMDRRMKEDTTPQNKYGQKPWFSVDFPLIQSVFSTFLPQGISLSYPHYSHGDMPIDPTCHCR